MDEYKERLNLAKKLREEGRSYASIGKVLGVTRQRVYAMLKADRDKPKEEPLVIIYK